MTIAKSFFVKYLILIWSIICISVFVFYPGRISVLYGSSLENWPSLLSKLGRIEPLNFISNMMWSLLGILIFSILSTGLGGCLIQFLTEKPTTTSESFLQWTTRIGTAFLFGQAFLSVIFLALAEFNQFTTINVILIWFICFIAGIHSLAKFFSNNQAMERINPFNVSEGRFDKLIIGLTICIMVLSLMYSTARLSYDSVALYFSNAKIIALTGRIQYFLNDSYIVSSLQTGIQYAALIQVFGDEAARMYSWVSGIVIILFSLAIGEAVGLTRRSRIILLILILTSTAFLDLLGDGKIDLASSAPALAAIYWMIINNEKPNRPYYLIIGVLTGLAMISRPFNIFTLGAFIGIYYLQLAYHQVEKNLAKMLTYLIQPALWIGLSALGVVAYHLIANWLIIGNPLTPLNDFQKANVSDWQWALDPKYIWIFRLLYPLVVTYLNTPQSLGNITPLFVAFLPTIFIIGLRKNLLISKNLIIVLVSAIITLFVWVILLFTVFEIRYILFLWIMLFIPTSVLIENILVRSDPFFKIILRIILTILLSFIALRIVFISLDTYSPIDHRGNPQCYDSPLCQFLKSINEKADLGDRVLTLNAYRYYLRTDLFACSTTHDQYSTLQNLSQKNNAAFWAEVYHEGYKYIAYESNYSVRHLHLGLIPNPNDTPPWLILKPIYGQPGDSEVAYQIQTKDPPIKVEFSCQKTLSGVWEVQQIKP